MFVFADVTTTHTAIHVSPVEVSSTSSSMTVLGNMYIYIYIYIYIHIAVIMRMMLSRTHDTLVQATNNRSCTICNSKPSPEP